LATALAKAGRPDQAEAILSRHGPDRGSDRILAEVVDPRNNCFVGNTPLLFSHVEYVRARMELAASLKKI